MIMSKVGTTSFVASPAVAKVGLIWAMRFSAMTTSNVIIRMLTGIFTTIATLQGSPGPDTVGEAI